MQTPKPPAGSSIDPILSQLAARLGILPEYQDNWGQAHATTTETARALVAAMGSPAEDAATAAASLHALDEYEWQQILPPVCVVHADTGAELTFHLPAWALEHTHAWRISLEHGHVFGAPFAPRDLPLHAKDHFLHGEPWVAVHLALPGIHDTGYHTLEIVRDAQPIASMPLIVCPHGCYMPGAITHGRRVWGPSVQLYGVRTSRNWGLGDYADLRALVDWAGDVGADIVGVSPLHALYPHNPAHRSPYSPSSRRFHNILHLAVDALPEYAECAEARLLVESSPFQARLAVLRAAELVDYPAVAELKYPVLERLYKHFREHHLNRDTTHARTFREYRGGMGDDLEHLALYQALHEHFQRADAALWGWPVWPETYRNHDSPEVQAFAAEHRERVEWFQWLQWHVDRQLADAGRRSFERGLGIGLYFDVAVGVDRAGAETWTHPELYALEAKIGCPPDDFGPLGQDWGLPPWNPARLRAAAYAPFIAMLRAGMKHAGALRIDHVMGLMRLYWIPPGMRGDQGAYIAYPFRDLLGILALESQRNRCLVVGEDLGTVPGEVRAALHDLNVLSYRLFYFERNGVGDFLPPDHFPEQALVAAATHDLPPLAGYWQGSDIATRTALSLFPDEAKRAAQVSARAEDKHRILAMLEREGLLPYGVDLNADPQQELSDDLIRAIHRHLARTPCKIALAQPEDMLAMTMQANLPGTVDQHPNWRRRLPVALEDWPRHPGMIALTAVMRAERPK